MMKRKVFKYITAICVFLFILFGSSFILQINSAFAASNDKLADKKTEIEIKKLESELSWSNITPWIQFGTLLAALIATGVSLWSASNSRKSQIDSMNNQIEKNRKDNISGLLKELSDTNISKRLATIQALSEYEEAVPYILKILLTDDNNNVTDEAISALKKMPYVSFPALIEESTNLREKHFRLAGEYLTLLEEERSIKKSSIKEKELKENVVEIFDLYHEAFTDWLEEHSYTRIKLALLKRLQVIKRSKKCSYEDSIKIEQERVLNEWDNTIFYQIHSLVDAAKQVIPCLQRTEVKKSALKEKILLSLKRKPTKIYTYDAKFAYLPDIVLDEMDLSNWNFEGAELKGASFARAICKGSCFKNTYLSSASFRSAKLQDKDFSNANIKQADFEKAAINRANFQSCEGLKTSFAGAKLKNTCLKNAALIECKFAGAVAVQAIFNGAKLFRSNFVEAVLNDADFSNAILTGARLNAVKADRTLFNGASLISTELNNGVFINAIFNGTRFEYITEFKEANFKDIKINNPVFGKETTEFQKYLSLKSDTGSSGIKTNNIINSKTFDQ
jgi:uncharacterized protein YjbI with pentapeptide repeats